MADQTGPAALPERGELTLSLAGVEMGLRPSYEAIAAAEATTDRGLIDLARDALAGKLSLSIAAQVAAEFVRAWGREHDDKGAAGANAPRIARLMLEGEGGFHGALKTLSACLSLAVTGGYDAEGNLKPSATTTTETAKASVDG